MIETWAVIASRSRRVELTDLVTRLASENVRVVVVDNGYDDGPPPEVRDLTDVVVLDTEQPPNLSRLWNVGLDTVMRVRRFRADKAYNVVICNDDAVPPPGWVRAVTDGLRSRDPAAAACSGTAVRQVTVKRALDRDLTTRMCPHAFALRGEASLRFDETLRWWWSDTDMDFQARLAGGLVIIPGYPVVNLHANSTTVGELAEQAKRDRLTFSRKWGYVPW